MKIQIQTHTLYIDELVINFSSPLLNFTRFTCDVSVFVFSTANLN